MSSARFRLVLAAALLAALALPSLAWSQETMYISDHLQVTVRTGTSMENKIIAVLDSGDMVKLLDKTADGWGKIITPKGKEGWMLLRYLTVEKPAALKLAELDPQAKNYAQKLEELSKENQTLKDDLNRAQSQVKDVSQSFNRLKTESADVLKLKKDYESLKAGYQEQAQQMKMLSAENESLKFGTNLKWFLAGGGVLLVGWLMGLMLHRSRRNRHSLLE
ncbi:MAG: TIGR04211 family SH3 domain-containing protein [Deltaproteobacteria bacterium]|nr:TIGR04211 family SH3 domain-containing protein [Deltaproteobacteria bacterium]